MNANEQFIQLPVLAQDPLPVKKLPTGAGCTHTHAAAHYAVQLSCRLQAVCCQQRLNTATAAADVAFATLTGVLPSITPLSE
jgi:hypothetical protein